MTPTGSPALWALGEGFGVIPAPPDAATAKLLGDWWQIPRSFGCPAARPSAVWTVIAPNPAILCPRCATETFLRERRCCFCGRTVRPSKSTDLVFEVGSHLRMLGHRHHHCG